MNNNSMFDDWMDEHFSAWQTMIENNRVNVESEMPLSFRKTLASIYSLNMTMDCPESER